MTNHQQVEVTLALISIIILLLLSGSLNGSEVIEGEDRSVARVIWSEGASCSYEERTLIASVMKNRIGHKGFSRGKLKSLHDVSYQKGAFSCINDPKNRQWKLTKSPLFWKSNKQWKDIWIHCMVLSRGTFQPRTLATCYHDKSISKPSGWISNKYYSYVLVEETPNFCFYKVIPKRIK
jgi:hypothetical protein